MFLLDEDDNLEYILNEADPPNAVQPNDQPMENSADMSGDPNGMGEEPPAEPGAGQSSDQADMQQNGQVSDAGDPNAMGGDMGMGSGDPNAMGGDPNAGLGGGDQQQQNADPEDQLKKRRLFKDYKDLYFIIDDLNEIASIIPYENLSDDSKKIFNFIEKKMVENFDKVRIIMTEKFEEMEYKELMILFIYIKTATKAYAELLKYFSAQTDEK